MGARRLQDTGRNGTLVWILIGLTAIMQIVALLTALAGPFGAVAFLAMFLMLAGLMLLNLAGRARYGRRADLLLDPARHTRTEQLRTRAA